MSAVSNWMHVETFTVQQAAALWCGLDPGSLSEFASRMPSEAAAIHQMLTGAIVAGELEARTDVNALTLIGNHSASMVQRSDLKAYAQFKNLFPAFLFDTLAPFAVVSRNPFRDILEQTKGTTSAKPPTNRGGRPAEYDWDSFTMEIIRRANGLDGLPDTQAELVKDMLEWFDVNYDAEPAESSVKQRISKIYKYLKET